MPFYEYQCSSCGHRHEELQRVSDRPLRKCPDCGRNTLKRLMSAPAFRLKGGGWYETDFKKDQDSRRNLAVENEPAAEPGVPAEEPKKVPADAAVKDANSGGPDAKAKPADAKAADSGVKRPPARKARARRRTRR